MPRPRAPHRFPITLGRVGEWGFLGGLLPSLSRRLSKRVLVGPGDDAAIFQVGRERVVVTTDALVEGVHFRTQWTSAEDLGHKVLAVNLSDLAAMGDVEPLVGVVAAGVPPETPVDYLRGIFRGLGRLARRYGFEVVGGDTVRAGELTFSLTALGRVRGPVFRRSGARVGDALLVTGTLGSAAAGLELLEKKGKGNCGVGRAAELLRRLRRPEPRLDWARRLARVGGVTACLDCSDGFWRSVLILGAASGVGAEVWVDRLPVSRALADCAGERASHWALVGGEDYELVFTAPPEAARRIESLGFSRVVGTVVPAKRGVKAFQAGRQREVPLGFEHFNG